jgi:hypothetical protein
VELLQIRELLRLLRVLAPALGNPLRPETDNPNAARSEFARGSDETGIRFSLSPRVLRRRRSILHSPAAIPPPSMPSIAKHSPGAGKTTGDMAFAPSTTPPTTARSSSTPTATTSKRSATTPGDGWPSPPNNEARFAAWR